MSGLDFSPDGRLLATSGAVGEAPDSERVKIVELATRKVVREIDFGPYPPDPEMHALVDVRFAADGRAVVLMSQVGGSERGAFPPYLRRYDVRTGRPLGRAVRIGRRFAGVALTVPARRDRLLVGGADETSVVDAATLRVRRRFPVGGWSTDSRRTGAAPRSATRTAASRSSTCAPASAGPWRAGTRTGFREWSSPPMAAPSRAGGTTAGS